MSPLAEFLESGILELYVMGATSEKEVRAVQEMAARYPEVAQEIEQISLTLEEYALMHVVKPRATVKTLVLATVDYLERMKQGELPESPPVLTTASKISDYKKWLDRPEAVLPANADNIYARIIGYTPKSTTAILWVREQTEQEVHHDEYERFLIVEGTCQITAGEHTYAFAAGDFFAVPLHTSHQIKVTSATPCKAVLQRLSVE